MRRRFIAATDGSLYGDHAVAFAQALALAADGEARGLTIGAAAGAVKAMASRWAGGANGLGGTAVLGHGVPGVEIVREAEAWDADLLVLGRQERIGGWPRPVGMTSDAAIRRRTGLSLLVPPHVQSIRRATIALDGSPRGSGVAAPATAILNLTKARAEAICVLPGPFVEPEVTGWRDPRVEWLKILTGRLPLDSGPCELSVCAGDPVAEILRAIRDSRSDLLVLGVRRGGQRGDSGSGYVGRELLRSAPCAVLTVPI